MRLTVRVKAPEMGDGPTLQERGTLAVGFWRLDTGYRR
jgi:hypothetical protein